MQSQSLNRTRQPACDSCVQFSAEPRVQISLPATITMISCHLWPQPHVHARTKKAHTHTYTHTRRLALRARTPAHEACHARH